MLCAQDPVAFGSLGGHSSMMAPAVAPSSLLQLLCTALALPCTGCLLECLLSLVLGASNMISVVSTALPEPSFAYLLEI